MSVNVKLSEKLVTYAREQSKIHHRTIGGQIDYWVSIGRLAENYPGLTFEHLLKMMRKNQLDQLDKYGATKAFQATALDTRNYRFDRQEANDR